MMICCNIVTYIAIVVQCSFTIAHLSVKYDGIDKRHALTNKSEWGCFFNNSYCDDSGGFDPVPILYNMSLTLSCDEYYDGNITIYNARYHRPVNTDDGQCDFIQCNRQNITFCLWDEATCLQDVSEETIEDWRNQCSGLSLCTLEDLSSQSMQGGSCGCEINCPCLSRRLHIDYNCTYYDDALPITTAEPTSEDFLSTDITDWTSESPITTSRISTSTSFTTEVSTESDTTLTTTTGYQSTTEPEDSGGGIGVILVVVLGALIIILIVIIVIVVLRKKNVNSKPEENKEELTMDKMPDILLSESSLDPKPVTRHIHSKYIPDITFAYPDEDGENNNDTDSLSGCDSYQAISTTFNHPMKSKYHHDIEPLTDVMGDDGDYNTIDKCSNVTQSTDTNPGKPALNGDDQAADMVEPLYSMPSKKRNVKEVNEISIPSVTEMVESSEYTLDVDKSGNQSTEKLIRTSAVEMVDNVEYSNGDEETSARKLTDDDMDSSLEFSGKVNSIDSDPVNTAASQESGGNDLVHLDSGDSTYTYVYQHFPIEGRERSPEDEGDGTAAI